MTDVTGVAIRSQSLQGQSAFFPAGEANLEPALSHLADIVSVRERRLACISFSLAGDAKKKSRCPPVFELVDEHALWHVRILIQVSSLAPKRTHPNGWVFFGAREET